MNFIHVTQADELAQICQKLSSCQLLMLDTEFVRTRTYYPKLGLIQLFDGETLALIDPIAIKDLSALWRLLSDKAILKVLHACSEDLEVFMHAAGFIPESIIDTQLMVAFLGQGLSIGFAALVNTYLGVELDKTESRTNWCARPLTLNQLNYAAADVFYLYPLYHKLKQEIDQLGRFEDVVEECAALRLKRMKKPDPDTLYQDIKNAWQLTPKQLAALQKLTAWRLKKAQEKDLALNFVIKDLHLWKMAKYNIRSLEKMASEDFDKFEIERHGSRLLRIMSETDKLNEADYPPKIERLIDKSGYKQGVAFIKEQVLQTANTMKLTPDFVGSNKQIHQLLQWLWIEKQPKDKMPELLVGWRGAQLTKALEPVLKVLSE